MSIAQNSLITWSDLSAKCLSSIKSICCNIGSYASNVPSRLRSGQGAVTVASVTAGKVGGGSNIGAPFTYYWDASPRSGLIGIVTAATVDSEWNSFLNAAGIKIDSRTNKLVSARDLAYTIGLFMEFMSYHVKPVYSRRQIYNTIESQSVYQGCKYISGSFTPAYTLTPIEPSGNAEIDDSAVTTIIDRNLNAWWMMQKCNNPVPYRCCFTDNA